MQIACCQFDIAWEDKPANFRKVAGMVREAKLEPGTLLVLPEMFATGYSMNAAALTEPAAGETASFLSTLASGHRIYVLGGVAVRGPAGKPRNESLVFDPHGAAVARYAKAYPFSPAREGEHYAAGDDIVTFDCSGCRVAMTVCYDLRFPELYRRAAGKADLFTVIASWPIARDAHWMALLRARAIENQAYVAGCNRCGKDPKFTYSGRSQVIDPHGEVVADAGGDERIIRADVNLSLLREYRQKLPFLGDIRRDPAGV
jgi:predicted amidohydrolase